MKWHARFAYVVQFIETHGRPPSKDSSDPEEVRAARWIYTQRSRHSMPQYQENLLDGSIPGWKAPRRQRGVR
jgi:hypothetical protein